MLTGRIGNTPTSSKLNSKHIVLKAVQVTAVNIGILPTDNILQVDSEEKVCMDLVEMPVDSLISSKNCSGMEPAEDVMQEADSEGKILRLLYSCSLREAATTHKQTFSINGETLRITVPAGVADGQVIKLKGHGGKGTDGGPDGDLYITFVIPDDPVFKRKENDLYTDVTIDLYTAVLGGEVTVNTLDGQVKLKVRPGTQNDAKVRLKGKGFPVYKQEGVTGDLIVTYHVTIPTTLTEKQKDLFRQLQQG